MAAIRGLKILGDRNYIKIAAVILMRRKEKKICSEVVQAV